MSTKMSSDKDTTYNLNRPIKINNDITSSLEHIQSVISRITNKIEENELHQIEANMEICSSINNVRDECNTQISELECVTQVQHQLTLVKIRNLYRWIIALSAVNVAFSLALLAQILFEVLK